MTPAPKLHTALLPGGGAAVMDTRTGRGHWQHLNATAAALWHQLTNGTPLPDALDKLTAHLTAQGADPDTVRSDLAALAAQLRELGLLTARSAAPPETTTPPIRLALTAGSTVPAGDRVAATTAVAAALLLLRCTPVRTTLAVARALARIPRTSATTAQADLLFAAVRSAARAWPGRAACLEESLACYLAGILRNRSVSWVLGARTAPAGAHAWNEADGHIIGQDPADRLWPYAPALRISN